MFNDTFSSEANRPATHTQTGGLIPFGCLILHFLLISGEKSSLAKCL